MRTCININYSKQKVTIKIKEDAEIKQVIIELKKKTADFEKLDKNVTIYITGKSLKNKEMEEIADFLQDNFKLNVEFDTPKILGLHGIKKSFSKEIATSETKFHRGSLRSGQKIEYEGSLVILGDVNAGSEVLAGENIVVLGILRGMAHAGAKGNKEAIIAAASIESPQIRISDIVKEIEDNELEEIKTCAYVNEDGNVILE